MGNRRVKEKHARDFGRYVRENKDWVAPALLLRAPDIFTFETEKEIQGTQFGILSLPKLARTDLRILDGQHRILGLHYAVEDIANELEAQRNLLAKARREGNADLERPFQKRIADLDDQRARLSRERISVQIHIEDEQKRYQQMFDDIAENALGITDAIKVRFDSRKVVNRSLEDVLKHALFQERVDMEQDRIGSSSPNLLGAKHVADIVRTIAVGIDGRVGRRLESELTEGALVEQTNNFAEAMIEGFPILDELVRGAVTTEQLRKSSLLGSTTMLRVLAGVYHELTTDLQDDEIAEFFSKLAPVMGAPIEDGSPWLETGVFSVGATAPKARRQDLKTLTDRIVRWARSEPAWVKAA